MTYLEVFGKCLTGRKATLALCAPMWILTMVLACAAFGQNYPPILTLPAPYSGGPIRLEPWTNGRYIIRDNTGRQVGTVEPYSNGWIIRDTMGRETGRVHK